MDSKGKKDKKRSSRSFCFGKSFTLRLPRSKSRDKLRMVQSKSVDCLNRKCVPQNEGNLECAKTSEKLRFDPEFFKTSEKLKLDHCRSSHYDDDHLDIHYSNRVQDELATRDLISSFSQAIEPNIPNKSHSVLRNRSKERIDKAPSDCKIHDLSRAGPCVDHIRRAGPCVQYGEQDFVSFSSGNPVSDFRVAGELNEERKVPSAPTLELNDDEVYTSRKGSFHIMSAIIIPPAFMPTGI